MVSDERDDDEGFGAEIAAVSWGDPYSDILKQLPGIYSGPDDPKRWARGYEPLPSQVLYHELETFYKGFSGPVGSGKSNALCREAIRLAFLNPGCPGLLGAPTFEMLADVTLPAFLEELDNAEIPYRWQAARKIVQLPGPEVKIFCRSLLDPRKRVGLNLAWAAIDELTFCPQESWGKIEARLRHPRAKRKGLIAVWTPRGYDWVWKRFKSEESKLPDHGCVYAKPRENFHLGADYYDRLEKSYDERLFKQEVLGEYLNIFVGQSYYAFDRKRNVAKVEFDPHLPVCWSMDFNVGRMSSVILQYHPVPGDQPKEVRVLDEIVLLNSNTGATCDEFLHRLDRLTAETSLSTGVVQVRIYGDAAGEARTSKADTTDYEVIRRFARRNAHRVNLTFHVQEANPSVRSRVASMNSMLRNERGETRLLIAPHCKCLIEDLEQVGWAVDAHGNYSGDLDKKNAALSHISDALGYMVWREAGLKMRGGPVEKTRLRF